MILLIQKFWALNKFLVWKEFQVQKIFGSKEVWSKNVLDYKNYNLQKIRPKKYGQNLTSNSWDIADMDKYHQGICCLEKCYHDSWLMGSVFVQNLSFLACQEVVAKFVVVVGWGGGVVRLRPDYT